MPTDDLPKRSLFLGLFVAGQVAFLIVANALQFVTRSPLPDDGDYVASFQKEGRATDVALIQNVIDTVGHLVDRYAEATGQTQAWKMFCPELPKTTLSPFVELSDTGVGLPKRWHNSDHLTPSDSFRWPSIDARKHHREFQTVMLLWELNADCDFETYRLLVNARRKTIESYLRRKTFIPPVISCIRPNRVTLFARYDSKPPTLDESDDRPVCQLNLKTGEWSIYHPGEARFIPESP